MPTVLIVQYGTQELGYVDPVSVQSRESPAVLSLGGYSWRVQSVDWKRRVVWVEPSREAGKSKWFGTSRAISRRLASAIKESLLEAPTGCTPSKRATARLEALVEDFAFLTDGATDVVMPKGGPQRWWTFAGGAANAVLAGVLHESTGGKLPAADNLAITVERGAEILVNEQLQAAIARWRPSEAMVKALGDQLKFSSCLTLGSLEQCLTARLFDKASATAVASMPVRSHTISGSPRR
jgi:ATP-dependent Lhr-like helicase